MNLKNESYVKQMKETLDIYHLMKVKFEINDICQDFNDLYVLKDGTVVRRLKIYMPSGSQNELYKKSVLQCIVIGFKKKGYNVELKSLKLYDGVGYDENVKIIKIKA